MLVRLLLLAIAIWALLALLRHTRQPRAGTPHTTDDMVQCAHCGLHLPASESTAQDGRHYCSPAHRDADR